MARLRVYELARKLNMPPKELLQELEELGVSVKNHMSFVDEEIANIIIDLLEEGKEKKSKQPSKPRKDDEEEIEKEITEKKKKRKISLKPDELKLDIVAEKLGIPQNKIIQDMFVKRGLALRPGQILKLEEVEQILKEYKAEIELEEEKAGEEEVDDFELLERRFQELYEREEDKLVPRPPVVTVMGHVDHGKTTLLDRIRSTRVAEREEGGITQSIGAYQVEVNGRKITFIDTPGHELFTEMRARGAQATDIVVLVVAADDGVMPQTIEAYNHAKSANVPIIVAINKIDKPNANVEKTKQELVEKLGLIPEEWGGDTVVVPISAKTGQGVDELLEMILLVADMNEIKCYPEGPARAVIIESKLDKKMGPVASVIVKDGVLKVGDAVVASNTYGKVRNLFDDRMRSIREAHPSQPVMILGFEDVPDVHSNVYVVESVEKAKEIVEKRREKLESQKFGKKHVNLEELMKMMKEKDKKILNIIVKADTYGSVAALRNAINKLQSREIELNIVHAGVGEISTSDIMLAAAVDAVVLGFRVKVNSKARKLAEQEGVDVRTYSIIYKLVDDLKLALEGMLEPEEVEEIIGHGEIKRVFKISKVGKVAGVQMLDGKADKSGFVRLYRNGQLVFEGKIESLKHYKEDVNVVEAPQECGIKLSGFDDIQEGDELEFYVIRKVKRKPTFVEESQKNLSEQQQ
ncbi:translation initiation factor IF-2 [Thermotoga sp. KOL6]|uniref:translation initiation factor IF-2 n=1 Tax=Thermotoga sp. KOL6 TaxID=126741 RepID=UPI000C75933C|nr:translation initiation factor IF-2 [Thermotoga sp. KOL6]PLV59473.1 translation initiation factor IF-2 [Thermotoga sp. KOL6]